MADKYDRCKINLRKIAPEGVPDKTINALVDKIAALNEREKAKGMKGDFQKAAGDFIGEVQMELARGRKEKLENQFKAQKFVSFAEQFQNDINGEKVTGKRLGQQMGEALKSFYSGGQQLIKGINDSISRNAAEYYIQYSALAADVMQKEGLWDLFKSGSLEREIYMEGYAMGEGGERGLSKSPEAKRIAEILHSVQRRIYEDKIAAGADVGYRENRVLGGQTHPKDQIRTGGYEMWKENILPKLDQEKTFGIEAGNPEKMEEFLQASYKGITEGRFARGAEMMQSSDELITTSNFSKLGNQLGKSRQLHFSDGAAYFDYLKSYDAQGQLAQNVRTDMKNSARAVSMIDKMGTNPDATAEANKVRIQRMLKNDPEALQEFNATSNGIDNIWKRVRGETTVPVDAKMAKAAGTVRAINSLSTLGATIFTALPDLANGMAIASSQTGQGLLHIAGRHAQAFLETVAPSARKDFSHLARFATSDIFSEVADIVGDGVLEQSPGAVSKATTAFFKYSGLKDWDEIVRAVVGKSLNREVAIHEGKAWGELPAQYRANLERYNIDERDWGRIKNALVDADDGSRIVSPDLIERELHGSDKIDTAEPGDRALLRDDNKSVRDTSRKWGNYLEENADFTGPHPTERVRARIEQGTQAGTISGEVHRFIGQFKGYALFTMDMASRIAMSNPDKQAFYLRDMLKGQGDRQRLIGWMVGASSLAYVGDVFRSVSRNETPDDPTSPWTWKKAFQRSGAAGLYGDVLLGEAQKLQQGGVWDTLLGPTASKFKDVTSLAASLAKHSTEDGGTDKMNKDALKAFNMVVRSTPGNNIFWLKTAMDKAILDRIRTGIDSDYEFNQRANMEKRGKSELLQF